MEFGWKRLNRQIDEYQSELVQTHYAEAVSYTHLDVYKRQVPVRREREWKSLPEDDLKITSGRF